MGARATPPGLPRRDGANASDCSPLCRRNGHGYGSNRRPIEAQVLEPCAPLIGHNIPPLLSRPAANTMHPHTCKIEALTEAETGGEPPRALMDGNPFISHSASQDRAVVGVALRKPRAPSPSLKIIA